MNALVVAVPVLNGPITSPAREGAGHSTGVAADQQIMFPTGPADSLQFPQSRGLAAA